MFTWGGEVFCGDNRCDNSTDWRDVSVVITGVIIVLTEETFLWW